MAGLLAVAVMGAVLTGVFQRDLDRRLSTLSVSAAVRSQIEAQRSRLAAAEISDPQGRRTIEESFVAGYRIVLWTAVGLALARSLSAAVLIRTERGKQ